MTHDELHELTGGYVLGALSDAERQAFEAHLATCAVCAAEVKALRGVAHSLAYAVPQRDLPPALRERVLHAAVADGRAGARVADFTPVIKATPARSMLPSWLAIAASIAAVALGLYAMTLRQRIEALQDRLREATVRAEDLSRQAQVAHAVADQAKEASAVLAASDVPTLRSRRPEDRAWRDWSRLLESVTRSPGLHGVEPSSAGNRSSVSVVGRTSRRRQQSGQRRSAPTRIRWRRHARRADDRSGWRSGRLRRTPWR